MRKISVSFTSAPIEMFLTPVQLTVTAWTLTFKDNWYMPSAPQFPYILSYLETFLNVEVSISLAI
jgi:hypothetical protein